jgi:hypothetical protein
MWQRTRSFLYTSDMVQWHAQATLKSPDMNHALSKLKSFRLGQHGEEIGFKKSKVSPIAIPYLLE